MSPTYSIMVKRSREASMNKNAEEKLLKRITVEEVGGKLQVTFEDPLDWAQFLRKIAIHKHTRSQDDANFLDDVMDCDSLFFAASSANEAYASRKPETELSKLIPFAGSGSLQSDSFTFKLIFDALKQKIEKGPCIGEKVGFTDHRLFIKAYFAPFLITDEQADNVVKDLKMRTDQLYGRAR